MPGFDVPDASDTGAEDFGHFGGTDVRTPMVHLDMDESSIADSLDTFEPKLFCLFVAQRLP